jgi:predicted KAP-like P-loop ATPase
MFHVRLLFSLWLPTQTEGIYSQQFSEKIQNQLAVFLFDRNASAVGQFAEQNFIRKRLFDSFVNQTRHQTRINCPKIFPDNFSLSQAKSPPKSDQCNYQV